MAAKKVTKKAPVKKAAVKKGPAPKKAAFKKGGLKKVGQAVGKAAKTLGKAANSPTGRAVIGAVAKKLIPGLPQKAAVKKEAVKKAPAKKAAAKKKPKASDVVIENEIVGEPITKSLDWDAADALQAAAESSDELDTAATENAMNDEIIGYDDVETAVDVEMEAEDEYTDIRVTGEPGEYKLHFRYRGAPNRPMTLDAEDGDSARSEAAGYCDVPEDTVDMTDCTM